MWSDRLLPSPQDFERDKRWADLIAERSSGLHDGWIAVVCGTDEHWLKLCEAMERPDLAADDSLRTLHGRIERIDDVTAIIAKWTRTLTREQVSAVCEEHFAQNRADVR